MRVTILMLVVLMAFGPLAAAAPPQRALTVVEERDAWRDAARAMPPGVAIKVELRGGGTVKGTLVSVTDDAVFVKTRAAEPAVAIAFTEVERIERTSKKGWSIAKAIGVGAGAGAGVFLTMMAVALMMLSD